MLAVIIKQMGKARGYTLVELLIVIIVISVLASITVVGYNGVTQRAEDSEIASKVQGLVKLFSSFAATTDGTVPQADWACVGEPEDYPAENGYTAQWCHQPFEAAPIPNGDDHPINATLNARLKATLINHMPNGRIPEVDLGGGTKYRGILYDSSANQNGGKPVLQYYVKGNRTTCPIGTKEFSTATYTRCNYLFQTIVSETGN